MHDVLAIAVGVAVAAVDRDGRAGGDDARSRHVAALHGVAQGEDGLVAGAQISDGGEAGVQGAASVAGADHGLRRRRLGDFVQPPGRALLAGQVDVAVDQAGQDEGAAQIDHLALADEAVADFDNLVPSDHESFISQHPAAGRIGQKSPHLDERGRLFR
ncbi:hypothetical protein D3C80_1458200 [compost metagenome]